MKIVKIDYKRQYFFKGSIDHFVHADVFVGLSLLSIIAVYSLSVSIIIVFKIITKSCKISLKLPF